jgi:hypothetical protein
MKPNERLTVPVSTEQLNDFDRLADRFPLIKRAALARRAIELGFPLLLDELANPKPAKPKAPQRTAAPMTREEADALRAEMVASAQARAA